MNLTVRRSDLLLAVADEIPPQQDLFAERRAAEQDRAAPGLQL